MSYAIFGDSYVEHLKKFTRGDMRFKYPCKFYGVSGMATDNKFKAEFDRLCRSRPRYLFFYLFIISFIYLFIQNVDKLVWVGETGSIRILHV